NRAWAQLFGRGVVNPVDNLHADNPASHPALLDLLAREFADSGFDAKHVFRCVCNSRAYQRSSRPVPGNAAAAPTLFARMAVKPSYGPSNPREEFALYFRGQGGADPSEFAHGIPQFLRRMNGEQFNAPAPVVERLVREGADTERAIEVLFLTALSRRPTSDERALLGKYVASRPTPADGYAG